MSGSVSISRLNVLLVCVLMSLVLLAILPSAASAEKLSDYVRNCGGCSNDQAFRNALTSLLSAENGDGYLDLEGKTVTLASPVVVKANRRRPMDINNGQVRAGSGSAWNPIRTTHSCRATMGSFNLNCSPALSGSYKYAYVSGHDAVVPGSVVVSRTSAGFVQLSEDAKMSGTFNLVFTRPKYLVEIVDDSNLYNFGWRGVTFDLGGRAGGFLMGTGSTDGGERRNSFYQCAFNNVLYPAVHALRTSAGLAVDDNTFTSTERGSDPNARQSIGVYLAQDAKVRNNRFNGFGRSIVVAGHNTLVTGNTVDQSTTRSMTGKRYTPGITVALASGMIVTSNTFKDSSLMWVRSESGNMRNMVIRDNKFSAHSPSSAFRFLTLVAGDRAVMISIVVANNEFTVTSGSIPRFDGLVGTLVRYKTPDFTGDRGMDVTFQRNKLTGVTSPTETRVMQSIVRPSGGKRNQWQRAIAVGVFSPFDLGWSQVTKVQWVRPEPASAGSTMIRTKISGNNVIFDFDGAYSGWIRYYSEV